MTGSPWSRIRAPLFHFLLGPLRLKLVMGRKLDFYNKAASVDEGYEILENAVLRDYRSMKALFPDAEIRREKLWMLMKSLVAIR
jgi:hypothetical protein